MSQDLAWLERVAKTVGTRAGGGGLGGEGKNRGKELGKAQNLGGCGYKKDIVSWKIRLGLIAPGHA